MDFNDFWLKSVNGKKISLHNLKELKKSDLKGNSAMLNIFNAFNTNGDEKLDKSELTSLFQKVQSAAQSSNGTNTSIFELEEAEEFINQSPDGKISSLKDLGVVASDMFEFLESLIKPESEEQTKLTKKDNNFTYTMTLKDGVSEDSEGVLEWSTDSLSKIRTVYPGAETAYLKGGKVVILDKSGEPVVDRNGNPVEVEFKEKQQTFSEELAEIIVLGHKASRMEKLMYQAEIQKELERLNSIETPSESYLELSRSVEFQKMNKKEQTEAMLKWTGEKFYKAKKQGDISAMKEYLVEGFGLAFQKMDMASVGNTNISVEGFKNFLKTWSGLNALVEQLDKTIDDGDINNLSDAEKIWAFTKGVGDAVDSFIGTQGVAFIGSLSLAGEAAAAGGIGEAWAVATQAYFAYEGIGSVAEGVQVLNNAETEEDYRQSGELIGNGAIMIHGAYKSYKGVLTGKLQAGLEAKKAIKEIKECKSIEEIKELRENLADLPYSKEEIAAMDKECIKRVSELSKEEGRVEGAKPKFGLEENPKTKSEESDSTNTISKQKTENNINTDKNITRENIEKWNSENGYNFTKEELDIIEPLIKDADSVTDIETIIKGLKSENRDSISNTNLAYQVKEMINLTKKYPNIPKETIFNLTNNQNLKIVVRNGEIRYNGFEEVIELASKHPKYQSQILEYFSKHEEKYFKKPDFFDDECDTYEPDNLYKILSNPNFEKIADIAGFDYAITGLKDGISDIGYNKYEQLNEILYGKENEKLRLIKENFKQKTGKNIHMDNNIPPEKAQQYVDMIIEEYEIMKRNGKEPPEDAYLTELVPEGSNGVFYRAGEINSYEIAVKPCEDMQFFKHSVLHEAVHMYDRNTLSYEADKGFRFQKIGTRLDNSYNPAEAEKLNNYAQTYVSNYSTDSVHEFVAEMGTMFSEGKISVEDPTATPLRVKIKEPFYNIDGKKIDLTPEDRMNIEELVEYYFEVGGQNFSPM